MSPISNGGSGGGSGLPTGGATSQVVGYGGVSGTGSWVYPPGYEIGYDQITANVTVSSATESSGTTVISAAAHTFDGGAVMAEFFSPSILVASSDEVIVSVFEASTQHGRMVDIRAGAAAVPESAQVGRFRFTPTAGSHTYTVTAFRGTTNGTIIAGAGGTGAYEAAYIRFTKV